MREALQTVAGVVSVVFDGFSNTTRSAQIEDCNKPTFIWIEPHIRVAGGQKYLYRTVAYQHMRTKRIQIRSECFKHITD